MNSKEKGNVAENKASSFLVENGFEIIDRNFYSKFGEIDIIAKKQNIYHFIEVKSGENFEAIYNITPRKLQRILKTINIYISKTNLSLPYQCDAIIIDKNGFNFIQNITLF